MSRGTSDHSPSLDVIEQVAAQGATAPRVTLTAIKNNIASVHYLVPGTLMAVEQDHTLNRLTLCFITTRSGFTVVGQSAPLSAGNFDPAKGQTFAYEDALRQLWPLMAFAQLERDWLLGYAATRVKP